MVKEMLRDVLTVVENEWAAKVALIFFILLSLWWVYLNFIGNFPDDSQKQLFAAVYGLMALWGAIWGFLISRQWGGYKSIIGKAIIFFSLGLFAQEFGQLAYSYYIYYLHIEVPYPSLGDIGYFSSILFYIYGVVLLAKASGVRIFSSSLGSKLQAVIIPLIILSASYWMFLRDYSFDWSNPLKIFLDFGYPLGQSIYISLAVLAFLLSRKILGGLMRNKILFILAALFVQYVADYTFLYQSSRGLWKVGEINDLVYLIAYLVMASALFQLKTVANNLSE